jgi:hypothetical protein
VAEVPISNTPRATGESHYGLGRTFRVLFDILTIRFLLRYFTRPMHFFGTWGLAGSSLGGLILLFCAGKKIITGGDIVQEHGPLMLAGGLLLLAGLMMFCTGLLGEVMIRTYFESQGRRIYAVRQILTQNKRGVAGEAR